MKSCAILNALRLPGRWAAPPIRSRPIQHCADRIDLECVVILNLVGIRADEDFNAIVLRYGPMTLSHRCGNVFVPGIPGDVQIIVIPKELRDGLFLLSFLGPGESKIADALCPLPVRLVELPIDLD